MFHHIPIPHIEHGLSADELTELASRCIAAKGIAYCPYSNFPVGCAILCDDGSWVTGSNVENASYPVTICAERTAIVKAVTEGKRNFRALGVATNVMTVPCSPCGMCRQFIREFAEPSLPIFMFGADGNLVVMTLDQLLPMSFGPDSFSYVKEMKLVHKT
ncbi:cytidine deaminase-like protein [Trichophaea hybrida]|nr:cytidine deaminase-like protein [Trichophaea hybrida]